MAESVTRLDDAVCRRLARRFGTPCFAVFPDELKATVQALSGLPTRVPRLQLAYPIKTMPLAFLLRQWRRQNLGTYVEASSKCELRLALRVGFPPERIIVSGPGKADWISELRGKGFTVIADSRAEVAVLMQLGERSRLRVGLRFAPSFQVDPDHPSAPDQFGLDEKEFRNAAAALRSVGVPVRVLQFHLGGWSGETTQRARALRQMAAIAATVGLEPEAVDIGGGYSQSFAAGGAARAATRAAQGIESLARETSRLYPTATEVIAECGRVCLGPTAALVLSVVDVKQKYGRTYVICDGGRVNNALPSDWEEHRLHFPSSRSVRRHVDATVCGPTCMAWDFLSRTRVPADIHPGAFVVYESAGAYHWSWQSSFSHLRASAAAVTWSRSGRARIQPIVAGQSSSAWLGSAGV